MMKKLLALVLVVLTAGAQSPASALAAQSGKGAQSLEQMKVTVDRAGLGEKARVTVRMKDGSKLKGYVSERREDDFVVRDRKTGTPTIIAYRDVSRVEINRGHSTARNVAIGTAIGVGAVLTTLALLIASLDD